MQEDALVTFLLRFLQARHATGVRRRLEEDETLEADEDMLTGAGREMREGEKTGAVASAVAAAAAAAGEAMIVQRRGGQ